MSSSRFAPVQQIACTLSAADHLGERQPELGRAHRAGERHEHLAAGVEVAHVAVGGVDERGGVEVPVVVLDEIRDRAHLHSPSGVRRPWKPRRVGNSTARLNGPDDSLPQGRTDFRSDQALRAIAKWWLTPLRHGGYLLRQAVQRAEAGDERAAIDRHDAAAREAAPRIAARRVVLRATEHGHEHGLVRDVEVRVARRQALRPRGTAAPASAARSPRARGRRQASASASRWRLAASGAWFAIARVGLDHGHDGVGPRRSA